MADLHPEVLALIEAGPQLGGGCPRCHGTGKVMLPAFSRGGGHLIEHLCHICKGHGKLPETPEEFARRIALRQHEIDERENADLRAKLEEATKGVCVARAERDIYSARLDAAIKLIADIISVLPPNSIKAPDGTVYEFNPPPEYAMKMLRAFKAAIDAAIAAGKGEK